MRFYRLSIPLPVWLLAMALLAGWVGLTAHSLDAAEAPEPSPTDQSWRLAFSYEQPAAIAIADQQGDPQWYWYLPYKVTNHTAKKQLFVPSFTITDNTGRVISAEDNVTPRAFHKIKKRLGNPLLRSPANVAGTLLVGEDHAKESVAIWPASTKDVDSFRIFVGGLSGETQTMQKPGSDETVTLHRMWMIHYQSPGDRKTPENQPLKLVTEEWVMR